MRRFERVNLVIVVGCAMVGAVCFVAGSVSSFATTCKVPSQNTKNCYDPNDDTVCSAQPEEYCSSSKHYTINQFPDGTDNAPDGVVMQVSCECYKVQSCAWDDDEDKCEPGTESSWYYKARYVVDEEHSCSEE